ncbi:hypothetical protein SNEBB_005520 [Seison nebaliae]|nr:hypothetical protein SNEBB_005520 [Seison nebaliae]
MNYNQMFDFNGDGQMNMMETVAGGIGQMAMQQMMGGEGGGDGGGNIIQQVGQGLFDGGNANGNMMNSLGQMGLQYGMQKFMGGGGGGFGQENQQMPPAQPPYGQDGQHDENVDPIYNFHTQKEHYKQ